jgi:hypothetical protein
VIMKRGEAGGVGAAPGELDGSAPGEPTGQIPP